MNLLLRSSSFSFAVILTGLLQLNGQVRYVSTDERKDAGMGVERVARFFIPAYESSPAKTDDEIRWIQIDLGAAKKIDGIKLLPKVIPWGYVAIRRISFTI